MTNLTSVQIETVRTYKRQADYLNTLAQNIKRDEETLAKDPTNVHANIGKAMREREYYQVMKYLDEVIWWFNKQGLDVEQLCKEVR
ncbi:hypothetical protein C4588_02090 [Candidatus Parcubacteria bacterium]|nr:MAG: hypothetical protein C4588_02090 [Candidatus Parcubacteria bacterium]